MTPSAAVVVGMLDGRKIEIDFMATVLGVDDKSIADNVVTLAGRNTASGDALRIMLLHPLDCLRSRLANINTLRREDEQSLRQGRLAVALLKLFLDSLLLIGEWREAQSILRDLYHVIREECTSNPAYTRHRIDPLPVMKAFLDHPGLDTRWRQFSLASAIERLEAKRRSLPTIQLPP